MKKLITISCYFGKLPEHFPEFLRSIEMNPTIDFLLITDCDVNDPPSNMKVHKLTFAEIKDRIQSAVEFPIVLDRPYKLCDFRPIFGIAFRDLIAGYDFWGHCDLDQIFGDIRSFLPDSVLDSFDKIYKLGHLTYYRNTEENNNRYKLDGGCSFRDAFTTPNSCAFDEIAGMQTKFDYNHIPTYFSRDYADITYGKVRFALSDFQLPEELKVNNNFEKQVFFWENGHVYRAYLKDNQIITDEFNYIHFSRRKMIRNGLPANCNAYYITNRGMFDKKGPVTADVFEQYNPYEWFPELKRTLECKWKKFQEMSSYYYGIVKRKLRKLIKS